MDLLLARVMQPILLSELTGWPVIAQSLLKWAHRGEGKLNESFPPAFTMSGS